MSCYLRAVYVADPRDVFIRDAKVVNAGARRDGAVLQRCCDVNATILRHTPGVRTNPHEPETISLARSKDGWERWRSAPISIDQMGGNPDEGCVSGLHADIVGRRGFWNGERGRRRGGDPRRRSPITPFEAFLDQLRHFIASPKEHGRPTEHPPVTGVLLTSIGLTSIVVRWSRLNGPYRFPCSSRHLLKTEIMRKGSSGFSVPVQSQT